MTHSEDLLEAKVGIQDQHCHGGYYEDNEDQFSKRVGPENKTRDVRQGQYRYPECLCYEYAEK